MSTQRLLKEYIRAVLEEDGDGGGHPGYTAHDIMASGMAMHPYGAHYGTSGDLYKTFIQPFVDVFKTAAGKTKEMSVRAQTVVRTAFETVATTVIPILRDDYQQVFAREREALQKIKQEYGDVYQSNWDALLHDDLLVAAFFCQPAAFFTVAAARKAPAVLLNMASVLSGGQLDSWVDRVKEKVKEKKHGSRHDRGRTSGRMQTFGSRGGYMPGPDGGYLPIHHKKGELGAIGAGINYYENLVREDVKDQPIDLGRILSSDKLKERIEQSPVVKRMEQAARQMVQNTLSDVVKKASGVMTARTLEDLQQKTGAKLKGLDKLSEMPQAERQKAEQQILATTKKSMKEFYVQSLETQIKQAVDAGVPTDSIYVQDFQRALAKIKTL